MKCPYCNKDMNKDRTEIQKLCKKYGLNGELVNPGGRQLRFSKKGEEWLYLTDMCNNCDEIKIKKFLGVHGEK